MVNLSNISRVLTSAACLARSEDRARLCLSPIRIQRSNARSSPEKAPTSLGPAWHSWRPHQRHSGTGIWPDRDIAAGWRAIETRGASLPTRSPSQSRTPARKAGVLDLRDLQGPRPRERRTLRWREKDSNPQSRVRERFSRLPHLSSPDNARETAASNFYSSTARYS